MKRGECRVESGVASRRGADDRRDSAYLAVDKNTFRGDCKRRILSCSEKDLSLTHRVHNEILFDLCEIPHLGSSGRKDGVIVQIGDDVAVSWKAKIH